MQLPTFSSGPLRGEQNAESPYSIFPTFVNRDNFCWFNSVLQVIIHILKNKGETLDLMEPVSQRDEDIPLADALLDSINIFSKPGRYNVEHEIKYSTVSHDTKISLKNLMLKAMDCSSPQEQTQQQDAAECLLALLAKIPSFSFLWHQLHDLTRCDGCQHDTHTPTRNSIVFVEMEET